MKGRPDCLCPLIPNYLKQLLRLSIHVLCINNIFVRGYTFIARGLIYGAAMPRRFNPLPLPCLVFTQLEVFRSSRLVSLPPPTGWLMQMFCKQSAMFSWLLLV